MLPPLSPAEPFSTAQTKYPSKSLQQDRFTTFFNWTRYEVQEPYQLSTAGFFCKDAREGLVQCYHCGLLLGHWEFTDLPMVEHIRYFPTCDFLKSRY